MYTFEQTRVFINVAEAGSFKKAAEKDFTTASAVMKKINALEDELGVRLFIRTSKGRTLTKAGESFYNDAKHIIKYCGETAERASLAASEDFCIIRVGSSIIAPPDSLREVFLTVHNRYPNIKLEMVPLECSIEIFKSVGINTDILVVSFDECTRSYGNYDTLELARVPLCAAVSMNHRLAEKGSVSLSDLHGERIAMIRRGISAVVDDFRNFIEEYHKEITVEEIDDYSVSMFNECANSDKIFLAVGDYNQSHIFLKRIPIEWEKTSAFGIIYPKNASPGIKQFVNAVKKETSGVSVFRFGKPVDKSGNSI